VLVRAFADVAIRFEPGEPGTGFVFRSEIKGGAVPKEYIPGECRDPTNTHTHIHKAAALSLIAWMSSRLLGWAEVQMLSCQVA
jgi:hypothetical protein